MQNPASLSGSSESGNLRPAISKNDRVSLMSYGKNVKKMFNLTSTLENPVHLKNQIAELHMTATEDPNDQKIMESPFGQNNTSVNISQINMT